MGERTWPEQARMDKHIFVNKPKIPSEMEVAPCYKLLTLFALLTQFTLFDTVFTVNGL